MKGKQRGRFTVRAVFPYLITVLLGSFFLIKVIYLGVWFLSSISSHWTMVEHVDCRVNGQLCEGVSQKIQQELATNIVGSSLWACTRPNFCAAVKEKFPFIKDIEILHESFKTAQVTVHSVKPLMLVNELVMDSSSRLFEQNLFDHSFLSRLHSVRVSPALFAEHLNNQVFDCITKLSEAVLGNYKVYYDRPASIELVPTHQSRVSLIYADEKSIQDVQKLSLVEAAAQRACETGKIKRNEKIYADIRFKNNIIIKRVRRMRGVST